MRHWNDYEGIDFPISKKDFDKIEKENNICINLFCYGTWLTYPVHKLNEKFANCMDLWMITDKNKPHLIYIRGFNRFMCNKTKKQI